MSGIAIKAEGLGKRYALGTARKRHDSLRELIVDRAASLFRGGAPRKEFWALRDASFEIAHGENVGFVGLNGAGKSTLLKILSRITVPTTGNVRIDGHVGALLEVGTGFHGELTGRENVFLYGSILGMRQDEVRRKFDQIVEFSGIDKFIDTPVKRYSSGMYVRLAFAVAAHLDPDILLLDEVLAVGDLAFQRKCLEHAKALQKRDATIVFVSHNMFSIKTMCERVIYLKSGRILYDGPTDEGIRLYEEDCQLAALAWSSEPGAGTDDPIVVTACEALDEAGQERSVFDFGERMRLRMTYRTREKIAHPNFVVSIIRSDGIACCNYSTETDGVLFDQLSGEGVLELVTPALKLVAERYTIQISVRERGFQRVLRSQVGTYFHIRHGLFDQHFGVFHESAEWDLQPLSRSNASEVAKVAQSG